MKSPTGRSPGEPNDPFRDEPRFAGPRLNVDFAELETRLAAAHAAGLLCLVCERPVGSYPAVTSALGLDAWNELHPEDQRTSLPFCSDECNHQLGYEHGKALGCETSEEKGRRIHAEIEAMRKRLDAPRTDQISKPFEVTCMPCGGHGWTQPSMIVGFHPQRCARCKGTGKVLVR